jgi:hypothetical protein
LQTRSTTMSKKTSTKASTKKTAKSAKAKAPKKAKPEPKATGECFKGGSHDWTHDGGEAYCAKCKEPKNAKAKRGTKKSKASKPAKDKKLSAIDAAAKLLGETSEPMNCKAMIDAIAKKGWWSSPGGKTPHATLYSSIIREILVKGKEARFKKTNRGIFAFND